MMHSRLLKTVSLSAFLLLAFNLLSCSSDGTDGTTGDTGATGSEGISCWDLNEDGLADLGTEDANDDGAVNVLDCQTTGTNGTSGQNCWDLNGNGVTDSNEDTNHDGDVDIQDCTPLLVADTLDLSNSNVVAQMVLAGDTIQAAIIDVTIASPPVVLFSLEDEAGVPLIGLTSSKVRFTFAKLLPAASGVPVRWQSYINRIVTADGDGDDVLPLAQQAYRDSGGTLVDNEDGTYEYTFANDVTNITSPIAVAWEPNLTHRLGMEVRIDAEINPDNPTLTFVPDGSSVSLTRDIVTTSNCNRCHERLEAHGGGRFTTDYCVTCHNPGTRDQEDGALVDFAHFAHSIHSAQHRTDVGGPAYIVEDNDFSEVTFPRSLLYCEDCHTQTVSTPDGDNWKTKPMAQTCGGCHIDGLVTSSPDGITGLSTYTFQHVNWNNYVASNTQCTTCHYPGTPLTGLSGETADIEEAHLQGDKMAAKIGQEEFEFQILEITDGDVDQKLEIKFAVYNPDAGTYYDIVNGPNFTGSFASLNLRIGWNTGDYSNEGSGSAPTAATGPPAQPHSLSLATLKTATPNGDGTYTIEATKLLPGAATGGVVVVMDGHPLGDVDKDGVVENLADEEVLPQSVTAYFDPDQTRRTVVDTLGKCNNCHEWLSLHGGNRNSDVQVCVVCHNPDATDVNKRGTADPTPVTWGAPDLIDGKGEESIAMGHMIHGIHAANIVVYGYKSPTTGQQYDFSHVTYPGQLNTCTACHLADTYYAPGGDERPVTVGTNDRTTPADDEFITPFAAVCAPCHDNSLAKAHMELNGAIIQDGAPITIETITKGTYLTSPPTPETCSICHAEGKLADIGVLHGVK